MPDSTYLDWPFLDARHRELKTELDHWCEENSELLDPLGSGREPDLDAACRGLVRLLGEGGWLKHSVDISRPVLLAEISPGHYNLIDGNHRMEKARKMGINHILAYKLNVKQHIEFLTERKAYLSYVEYWNGKLK